MHVPPPSEKIKAEPAWEKLGIQPTHAQIQRIYTRKLYQDLYGGTPTSPLTPEVSDPPIRCRWTLSMSVHRHETDMARCPT
jgi:hypothetical protein